MFKINIKSYSEATVYDLKKALEVITHVTPENQNLLGVSAPRGPAPQDHVCLKLFINYLLCKLLY